VSADAPGEILPDNIDILGKSLYTGVRTGTKTQLEAVVLPANATDKSIQWISNNDGIASVSETGLVTAVGRGNAVITANTVNGLSATVVFMVTL
jgi:uncharacterized protein YjdB